MKRLDGGGSLRQLSLRRNDEVQVLEANVPARDSADAVNCHLRPGVDVETRKRPLPGVPTVSVSSKHQRVNLYYCMLDPDGVLKDTRFILI